MEVQLSNLSNRILHRSYWFLILDLMFITNLQLTGRAIMSWVMEKGGRVEMADIAKPDYGRKEDFTAKFEL